MVCLNKLVRKGFRAGGEAGGEDEQPFSSLEFTDVGSCERKCATDWMSLSLAAIQMFEDGIVILSYISRRGE